MNYNWDIVKWIKLVLGSLWKPNRALLIKCLLQPIIRMYSGDVIIIVANFASLPGTGEFNKVYLTSNTNKYYRWNGVTYSICSTPDIGFMKMMEDINNRTRYNSSQKTLKALLNKLFDPTLNRIYIDTISDEVTIYYQPLSTESIIGIDLMYQPIIADGGSPEIQYQLNIAEYVSIVDFIVYVPATLSAQESNIKAWVNYYRFASLTFKIIYI